MNHKELEVWKKSMDLVVEVYALSDCFPKAEQYGLTNQIRRAAVSVPSNIAEGAARETIKDNMRFITIASGSLSELETQLLIAKRLSYFKESPIFDNLISVRRLLLGFKKYLKNQIKK